MHCCHLLRFQIPPFMPCDFVLHFYRAMLCMARSMLSVYLSVCLSLTRRYCVATDKCIIKLLSPLGSTLFYPHYSIPHYSSSPH